MSTGPHPATCIKHLVPIDAREIDNERDIQVFRIFYHEAPEAIDIRLELLMPFPAPLRVVGT